MLNKIFYKHYVFLEEINDLIKENLLKFRNINIIIDINGMDKKSLENQNLIIKFSKRNKIPFFFKNNYQKCTKYKADGIFIDSVNKNNIKPILLKKAFEIIGSAHNQLEYKKKLQQKCEILMFSPLFYNEKYSKNKILNTYKFNLISLNWKIDLCALGGINIKTIKKIKLTKVKTISFKKLIFDPKIKNLPTI
jgi:thiamine monophosphate synthase